VNSCLFVEYYFFMVFLVTSNCEIKCITKEICNKINYEKVSKLQILISTYISLSVYPWKLIPMKMNETTVWWGMLLIGQPRWPPLQVFSLKLYGKMILWPSDLNPWPHYLYLSDINHWCCVVYQLILWYLMLTNVKKFSNCAYYMKKMVIR